MNKTRYKIRKEQLERVVESFVMESAQGTMIDKNAAKKHKMSMGAEQSDDMGEGMEKAKEVKKAKMKQAPEVKKHMKGSVSEAQIRKVAEHYNLTESEVKRRLTLIREFDEGAFKKKLKQLAYSAVKKGWMTSPEATSYEEQVEVEARKDNFEGDVKLEKNESGKWILAYVPQSVVPGDAKKKSIWQRMGMGATKQTRGK